MSIISNKILRFDADFNEPLDNLPEGIEEIRFDYLSQFNHRLDNLPQSLKLLKLGLSYNQPLDFLPAGLETLFISYYYKYPMVNFPIGLKKLGLPATPPPGPFGKHLNQYKKIIGEKVEFFIYYPNDDNYNII